MNAYKHLLSLSLVLSVAASYAELSRRPIPQTAHWTRSWWQRRIDGMNRSIAATNAYDVVMIGDSITQFFEEGAGRKVWEREFVNGGLRTLNLGISGDRTEHVLWRFDHGQLDGYTAKVFTMMLGTNNTGHRGIDDEPLSDTIAGLKEVVTRILRAHPESKLVLTAIFPCWKFEGRWRNEMINAEIRNWADGKRIFWLDINPQFVTADGTLPKELFPDALHPSEAGYEIWVKNLVPFVKAILKGETPAPVANPANPVAKMPDESANPPAARPELPRTWFYRGRISEKRDEILDGPKVYDLVMIGDSITHYWEWPTHGKAVFDAKLAKHAILNLGFAADVTQNLIWDLEYGGLLEGYSARNITLMIGTNNVNDPAEDVAEAIKRMVERIRKRQPGATLWLMPIFPKAATADNPYRQKNERTNAILKKWLDANKGRMPNVKWFDINARFLGADGTLSRELFGDLLHPTAKGYDIWADALNETVLKK